MRAHASTGKPGMRSREHSLPLNLPLTLILHEPLAECMRHCFRKAARLPQATQPGPVLAKTARVDGPHTASLIAGRLHRQDNPAIRVDGAGQRAATARAIRQSTPAPISCPAGTAAD